MFLEVNQHISKTGTDHIESFFHSLCDAFCSESGIDYSHLWPQLDFTNNYWVIIRDTKIVFVDDLESYKEELSDFCENILTPQDNNNSNNTKIRHHLLIHNDVIYCNDPMVRLILTNIVKDYGYDFDNMCDMIETLTKVVVGVFCDELPTFI